MTKLALALGGGGAAGLGHIPVLEAFDELGVRPVAISGTSIGALIGACYAAGMTGREIREHVLELNDAPLRSIRALWTSHIDGGLNPFKGLNSLSVLDVVLPGIVPDTFAGLEVPLNVVATDYYARRETSFTEGSLREALAASMSIPGVFDLMQIGQRFYIDGGTTNNLPFDVFPRGMPVLAVDISSEPTTDPISDDGKLREAPGALTATLEALRIIMTALLDAKLSIAPPTVLINPESARYQVLDFRDVPGILASAEGAREETKRALGELLSHPP